MNILDFPPEIFQEIMHELVSASGVGEAWKLRQVCHEFRSLELDRKILLLNRLKRPLNANPDFLAKIHQMLGFLKEELGTESPAQFKVLTEELCKSLSISVGSFTLFVALCGRNGLTQLGKALDLSQKLIAAISVNARDLVRRLLPLLSAEAIKPCIACIFDDPLTVAVNQGNRKMVRTILRGLQDMGIERCSPAELDRASMHGFDVAFAIHRAIRCADFHVFETLVDFFSEHFPPAKKMQYNRWLMASCGVQDTRILQCILELEFRGRVRIDRKVLVAVTLFGRLQHMKTLLGCVDFDVKKTYADTSPLISAVRGGNVDVVAALLDAGADVNTAINYRGRQISAMSAAIRYAHESRYRAIVGLLLKRGADLPELSEWKKTQGRFSKLRKLLERAKTKRRLQNRKLRKSSS
ncbi:hypothetical protein N0V83_010935 [Neocucurbitaria cava]|uniref:Ankyrin repeat protein n=1 Tax=Neocucurbitaria cava TaxID=798079 RepID=A0A9W9CH55_9PLEO|nr:hypothetical protein N0V83_010935 [Neocucurbitaria cava]